jgi:hypothetical protein
MSEPPGLGALARAITTGRLPSSARRARRCSVFAVREFSLRAKRGGGGLGNRGSGHREWRVASREWRVGSGGWGVGRLVAAWRLAIVLWSCGLGTPPCSRTRSNMDRMATVVWLCGLVARAGRILPGRLLPQFCSVRRWSKERRCMCSPGSLPVRAPDCVPPPGGPSGRGNCGQGLRVRAKDPWACQDAPAHRRGAVAGSRRALTSTGSRDKRAGTFGSFKLVQRGQEGR